MQPFYDVSNVKEILLSVTNCVNHIHKRKLHSEIQMHGLWRKEDVMKSKSLSQKKLFKLVFIFLNFFFEKLIEFFICAF